MANLAALRAAVFFAICEKPEGVDIHHPRRKLAGAVAVGDLDSG